MNVLIVVPWDQKYGGVASVVGNLAKHLQLGGHQVHFLHPDRVALLLKRGKTQWGFSDFKLRMGLPFSCEHPVLGTLAFLGLGPLTMFELCRVIRRHNIQVVNIHYPMDSFAYFAMCRRLLPIKLVTSIHGADIFPSGRPRASYSRPLTYLLRSSDLVVANSKAFQEDFLQLFPAMREKTIFIHNGVDLAELDDQGVRAQDKNGRYVLCIAAHNEKKGLDVLLRGFAEVAAKERSLKLILVGDGPLRPRLAELAISLKLDRQVEFLGNRGRQDVAKLLHGCEIFVLPSRSEPFGIAILEALACSKPVVAANTGGIPEMINNGVNGLLFESGNHHALAHAILTLLADSSLRKSIAVNGPPTVKKRFLPEHTGAAYQKAFSAILGSSTSVRYE